MSRARYVSQSVRRVEDPLLLTGRGRYLDDLTVPGMLSVAFVRSPHPHARVLHVDTRAALNVADVVAAWTGTDTAAVTNPLRAILAQDGYRATSWPPLAVD